MTFAHLGLTIGGTLVAAYYFPALFTTIGTVTGTVVHFAGYYSGTAYACLTVLLAQILLPINTLRAALRS